MSEGKASVTVTVVVKGAERVKALDTLVSRDHSSRAGVFNKALDHLVEHEGVIEDLCAAEVQHA